MLNFCFFNHIKANTKEYFDGFLQTNGMAGGMKYYSAKHEVEAYGTIHNVIRVLLMFEFLNSINEVDEVSAA